MPSVPAYIRNADWDKYQAIRDSGPRAWAEFIHQALDDGRGSLVKRVEEIRDSVPELQPIKTSEDAKKVAQKIAPHKNYLKK